mmetsp:Transcript_5068/g.16504  ORF Transcript_5068/g.16504 Transcript_5068/m.16504 type:complete len:268 (-) Transcript_5068:468-1271(-)
MKNQHDILPIVFVLFRIGNVPSGLVETALSARLFHTESKIVILCDSYTNVAALTQKIPDTIVHRVINDRDIEFYGHNVMALRMKAEMEFLKISQGSPSHIVMCDADILFIGSIRRAFYSTFSAAFTYRQNPKYPINLGIKFVHGNHLQDGFHLWSDFVKTYVAENLTCGACDQVIVANVLGVKKISRRQQLSVHCGVTLCQVHLLHCRVWNCIVGAKDPDCVSMRPRMLHFKGPKTKHLQHKYWMLLKDGKKKEVVRLFLRSKQLRG